MTTALITSTAGTPINGHDTADDTYTGIVDSRLNANNPTTSYASAETFNIRRQSAGGAYEESGIIKCTGLSNITGPVTVTGVAIGLAPDAAAAAGASLSFYRVLRDWTTSVTWNTYDGASSWTTAGALGAGDIVATASYSGTDVGTTVDTYYEVTSAGLIADVQGFINGALSNYGWLIRVSWTGSDSRRSTWSNEAITDGADAFRPYFWVEYTAGGGGGSNKLTLLGVG